MNRGPGRGRPRSPWPLLALLLTGCGGAAAAVTPAIHRTPYATTPTSVGAVNPAALPLGDGYVSSSPKVGYVDSCIPHFGQVGGAQVEGPWIDQQTKTWNSLTKLHVGGAVSWPSAQYKVTEKGGKRVISFNDLPIDHTTGVFPIQPTDPAFAYDRNPNHIAPHQFRWTLPINPKPRSASCTNQGPIGVLNDGVVLYNALDAEGRDAGAHEVLDACAGHPDPTDTYHHHYIPPCILDKAPNGRATLVGYATDGFGIYVQKNAHGVMPTNRSLDVCHGTTSPVLWNGKVRRIYHYVATLEYPYTIGCFRGRPVAATQPGAP